MFRNKFLKDKKAKITWTHEWAEIMAVLFLLFALIISTLSDAAIVTYFIIAACGIVVGRINYTRKLIKDFPFYLIVMGFLLGFILGIAITGRGNILLTIILFIIGIWVGQLLHKKRIFK